MHFVLVHKHLRPVPNPTKPCAQILIGLGTRFWHGFLIQSNTLYTSHKDAHHQQGFKVKRGNVEVESLGMSP